MPPISSRDPTWWWSATRCRASNPEAVEVERLGIARLSMPQALARFFLAARRPLVVAGTHGKTTTTALAAWTWSACGRDPGFLIGGVPLDLEASFRRGGGERFVIEGDEYNAAYFDRGAKFLHYRAETAGADLGRVRPRRSLSLRAGAGGCLSPADRSASRRGPGWSPAATARKCASCSASALPDADLRPRRGQRCSPARAPRCGPWRQPLHARRGRGRDRGDARPSGASTTSTNALAVWAAARRDGLGAAELGAAFARFRGVKRRQEELAHRAAA